jgi:hypothetical protein
VDQPTKYDLNLAILMRDRDQAPPELREAIDYFVVKFRFGSKRHQFLCIECGDRTRDMYMVRNEIWRQAVPVGGGYLHFACIEKRLGRPLHLDDFQDLPINREICYGWALRERNTQEETINGPTTVLR